MPLDPFVFYLTRYALKAINQFYGFVNQTCFNGLSSSLSLLTFSPFDALRRVLNAFVCVRVICERVRVHIKCIMYDMSGCRTRHDDVGRVE